MSGPPGTSGAQGRHQRLRAAGLGAAATLVLWLGAELILAAFFEVPPAPYPIRLTAPHPEGDAGLLFAYDVDLLWRQRPDQQRLAPGPDGHPDYLVRTNAQGLRGPAYPPAEAEPRLDVLSAGDSTAWGAGVDDDQVYARRLETLLDERVAPLPAAVLNAGAPGYASIQSARLIDEQLAAHDFDIALIHLMTADLFPAERPDSDFFLSGWRRQLARLAARSAVLRMIRRIAYPQAVPVDPARDHHSSSPIARVSPDRFREELRHVVSAVRADGATPVLLIPLPFHRPAPCAGSDPTQGGPMCGVIDLVQQREPAYRQVIAEVAQETSTKLVDLRTIEDQVPDGELYLDIVHPTASGHREIAELLADELDETVAAWRAAAE